MMKKKVISSDKEYRDTLSYVEGLMDATPGSQEEDELLLFSLLIEAYEEENYHIDLPDPIEAIKFRMEQENITRKDMIKYLGSQSKVSEVLNYKRPLSLSMIRALHEGLGIPAEVLLMEPGKALGDKKYSLNDFPFNEMFKRGYFVNCPETLPEAKNMAEELLEGLMSWLGNKPNQVFCRNNDRDIDTNALLAWQAKVSDLAMQETISDFGGLDNPEEFAREVIKLSYYSDGPKMVKEILNKNGIHHIILEHLPKTYLDGACFFSPIGNPIIAMTIRHDRLDNFWFTLAHELGHAFHHLDGSHTAFFDEIEQIDDEKLSDQEKEANNFARYALVPAEIWEEQKSSVSSLDEHKIRDLADQLRISPAIVAGRVRWENQNFSILSNLIERSSLRPMLFN